MEYREYPKWVGGVVVNNAAEEKAVLNETAVLKETVSAAGNTTEIVGVKEPEPFWPEGAPQLPARSEIRPETKRKRKKGGK